MAFEKLPPEWNDVGAEPPQSKKDSGFVPGEKPPAQWLNWLFNKIYLAVQELQTKVVEKVAGKQLSTEDYTSAEKSKLAGVAASANNYVHPANHAPSIITQDANNRFVTDADKITWNAKANATHSHAAGDISSGILPIPRGGTGASSAAGILTAAGVTATATELNILSGVTGLTAAELTNLGGITATAAELNILDGVTGVTPAELSYIGDVTGMIQAQLNAKSDKAPVPVNVSTSRNIVATYAGTLLHCNAAGAIVLTIQTNATVAIPINTEIAIDRWGPGAVSIAPAAGVTLQSTGGKRSIKNQYESAALKKIDTDMWLLVGSLSA